MAIAEPIRTSIALKLTESLGVEEAAALMAEIPTYDIGQIVTVDLLDLRLQQTELKLQREMADLRTELHLEMGEIKASIARLSAEVAALPQVLTRQVMGASLGMVAVLIAGAEAWSRIAG